jgi:hypothetical protein
LTDELLAVAGEAMQPLHISLWLRPSAGSKFDGTDNIRKA